MSIVITIVKFPENVSKTKPTITFAENGGTIGRSPDNDWVLEDPERFISSCHSKISYEDGQYYLNDTSTNGTFVNGASEPVGKGNKVVLNDGDTFALGDYEFQISVWNSNQQSALSPMAGESPAGPFAASPAAEAPDMAANFSDDPFAAPADSFAAEFDNQHDPFASPIANPVQGHVSTSEPLFGGSMDEKDPLAALDKANKSFSPSPFDAQPIQSDVFSMNSQSDQADAINQSVAWPDSVQDAGVIPEDWDEEGHMSGSDSPSPSVFSANPIPNTPPAAPKPPAATQKAEISLEDRKRALEKANRKIQAEIESLKQQSSVSLEQPVIEPTPKPKPRPAAGKGRKLTSSDVSLIEALGLDKSNLTNEQITEISQVVGELVRETIAGMMKVLSSRSSIKNEFRMNVTTIQPVENNPLKFSANIDDAMENMFLKSGNAFLKPVEAVREGFDGIAEHQVAILAGIRSAFKGVIERFNPDTLENRFEKFHKGGIIPGSSKARNWDAYASYYKELVEDMDNSFQHLFGYDFVQAYEDQLQKLAIARKTKQ